jgi:hypothetical protein
MNIIRENIQVFVTIVDTVYFSSFYEAYYETMRVAGIRTTNSFGWPQDRISEEVCVCKKDFLYYNATLRQLRFFSSRGRAVARRLTILT